MARIACLGGNLETETVLRGLVEARVPIAGLYCAHPDLRPQISDFAPLGDFAEDHAIPHLPITDINSSEAQDFARRIDADYLFVLGWSQLIAPPMLECFRGGVVGSHPTPLPFGKGRAPVPWTILENRRRSAVTLFQMTPRVDEGQIVSMRWFDVPERAYAIDVYRLVAENLRDSFVQLVGRLDGTGLPESPDSGLAPSFYARRTAADGWIDFSTSADAIDRLVRAVSYPYPGAYAYREGKRVVFHCVEPATDVDRSYHGQPGQVLRKRKGMMLVQCGDLPLWLGNPVGDTAWKAVYEQISLGSRFGRRVEDNLHHIEKRLARIERQLGIT